MSQICKDCRYFNFKSSGDKSWGQCLNPFVVEATRVSLTHVDINPAQREEVKIYARIYFDENSFGCIHFGPEERDSR